MDDDLGFGLRPRLPIYDAWVDRPGFLAPALRPAVDLARARLEDTRWGTSSAWSKAS